MKQREIEVIHDWDYAQTGKRAALRKSLVWFLYFLSRYFPPLKRWCTPIWNLHKREATAFKQLNKLLGVHAKFFPRKGSRVVLSDQWTEKDDPTFHIHLFSGRELPKERDVPWKVWQGGVGDPPLTEWTCNQVLRRMAMPDLGLPITDETDILNVHVVPARGSIYYYIDALATLKKKGIKWK